MHQTPNHVLQRKCSCGAKSSGGDCAECRKKQLQRTAASAGPAVAPPVVHQVLASPGQPLPASERAFFEPRFGHDFSRVRVHTDGGADSAAQSVGARAFAVGRDLVFARGQFTPGTSEGRTLLAHELTHVVQQGAGGPRHTEVRRPDITPGGPMLARQRFPGALARCRGMGVPCPGAHIYQGQIGPLADCYRARSANLPFAISPGVCVYYINGRYCSCVLVGTSAAAVCVFTVCDSPGQASAEGGVDTEELAEAALEGYADQQEAAADEAPLQTKLAVGTVSDPLEDEADRVARSVMAGGSDRGPIHATAAPPVLRRKGGGPNLCGGVWSCADTPCDQADPGSTSNGSPPMSWTLKVHIDVEAPSASDVTASTVGHTYLEFSDSTGAVFTYGFYPNKSAGTPDPIMRPEVWGCMVHPDTSHESCVDYTETFSLTQTEYQTALAFAQVLCKAPPTYNIQTFNCTTFVKTVVERAGKSLPPIRGKVASVVTADNPYTLIEGLRRRDAGPTYGITSDSDLRTAIAAASAAELTAASVVEKVRVINRLLDGWVSDDDMTAIETVCAAVATRDEMVTINRFIHKREGELSNDDHKRRLHAAVQRLL